MQKQFYKESDGWLFATLKCLAKRKLNLYSILSVGNTLNHAIFTIDQINDGLSRLESDDFIKIVKRRLLLMAKAKAFIRENHLKKEACIAEQVRYSKIFSNKMLGKEVVYKEYFNIKEYELALEKLVN